MFLFLWIIVLYVLISIRLYILYLFIQYRFFSCDLAFKRKLFQQNSCDDFNIDRSLLPARATFNFNVACAGKIEYL